MLSICEQFQLKAQAVSCAPYGNGHINATYLVKTAGGPDYILQRISRQAFHDVPALMRNVALVTAYLAQRDPDPRHTLHLVPALDGRSYWQAQDGEYYRVYDFIIDSVSLDRPERPGDLYACAHAFGRFQQMLGSFPAQELSETIPHFHDTPARYRALREAIAADRLGRAKECEREIAFALAREEEAGTLMRMLAAGELPLRVTHNDTKLNNVMLDVKTHEAVCVIDLDTVMPGLAANDFGVMSRGDLLLGYDLVGVVIHHDGVGEGTADVNADSYGSLAHLVPFGSELSADAPRAQARTPTSGHMQARASEGGD